MTTATRTKSPSLKAAAAAANDKNSELGTRNSEPSANGAGAAPVPSMPDEMQTIPLRSIAPSPFNPRKTFDQGEIEKLAMSIRAIGVLEPIIVRRSPESGCRIAYQLVAGERRVRAAALAGLMALPAIVRVLSDRQVLEMQIVENEQREDVPALERADGYHALTKLGVSPEAIAAKVGKSASTIHALLKLRQLPGVARKAIEAGILPAATAGLIARVPGEKLRERVALQVLADQPWWQPEARLKPNAGQEPLSYRDTKALILTHCTVELKGAPFDRKSLDLVPEAGSCDLCPKRVGNLQKAEPENYKGARADVCTNPECHRSKMKAHAARVVETAKANRQPVLDEEESKSVFRYGAEISHDAPYFDLDETCFQNGAPLGDRRKKYRDLLVPHIDPKLITLAYDRQGKLHEIVSKGIAVPILQDKHAIGRADGKRTPSTAQEKRELDKAREEQKIERETSLALLGELAKITENLFGFMPAKDPDVKAVLHHLIGQSLGWDSAKNHVLARRNCKGATDHQKLDAFWAQVKTLDAPGLMALLVELKAGAAIENESAEFAKVLNLSTRRQMEKQVREQMKKPEAQAQRGTTPRCASASMLTLATLGIEEDAMPRASLVGKFADKGKKTVHVQPVEFEGRLWVWSRLVSGGVHKTWTVLPLYTLADFRAKFKQQPTKLSPKIDYALKGAADDRQRDEFYTGVLVRVSGETFAIGPYAEELTLTNGKAKPK